VWKTLGGLCIRLSLPSVSLFNRVRYLFFLNEHTKQNLLLLADMKVVSFPKYKITKDNSLFSTREELIAFEEATKLEAEFDGLLDIEENTLAIQIVNRASKWLLSVHDEKLDPFRKISNETPLAKDFQNMIKDLYQGARNCFSVVKTPQEVAKLVADQPFLSQFSIGWIFARIVSHGLAIFEKQKLYNLAVLHLRVLLCGKYCPGKFLL
jgi:hypothetical protein